MSEFLNYEGLHAYTNKLKEKFRKPKKITVELLAENWIENQNTDGVIT